MSEVDDNRYTIRYGGRGIVWGCELDGVAPDGSEHGVYFSVQTENKTAHVYLDDEVALKLVDIILQNVAPSTGRKLYPAGAL